MAHGGTSFGFWAGANYDGGYQPDISSYDYDSAINEAGEATARYQRLREVIKPFAQWDVPEIPEHVPFIRIAEFTPQPYAGLTSAIKQEVFTKGSPLTFE
jgi:beta-galactosidase